MASKDDKTVGSAQGGAAPWAAGWSAMANDSLSNAQRELSSLGYPKERIRVQALPKNALRRIQRVGFAATSVAATIWLLAIVWLWPVGA